MPRWKTRLGSDEAMRARLAALPRRVRATGTQQFVGELAADRGADLRDHLAAEPSRSSRAISEACNVVGTAARRARRRSNRPPPRAAAGSPARLGQLLDEQRHAVGALDDLGDDLGGQGGLPPAICSTSAAPSRRPEPIERQHRDLRLAGPGRLELGTEGDDQQHRQTAASARR